MTPRRLHPFDVVACVLAGRLQGCAPSEQLRAMIRSAGVAWERVLGQASAHLVLPAFAAALRDLDLVGSLDEGLSAFLRAVHGANVERNDELRAELAAAIGILNRAGIEPVLLKGAIRLVDQLYPDRGWRMLRDLDLLVPHARLAEAIRAFELAGYARLDPAANELRRPGGPAQIDLHAEPFSTRGQAGFLSATEILEGSRPAHLRDLSARLPTLEHQLVHLIGHSQIRHLGHALGHVSLRDRLEAAALLRWSAGRIDLQAVWARFVAAGYRRPVLVFLLALDDGDWCALPVPGRIDLLTALQQRRVALQARSTTFAYVGSRAGLWLSEGRRQIADRQGGERKAVNNFRRLMRDRGALWSMARAFLNRRRDLVHLLPPLGWLVAQ